MKRLHWVLLGVSLVLGACTQRMVCPAYQSAFIYDKDELRKKFSYFQDDSIPKVLTASKNKYLIAEPTSYRKKVRSLATVEMKEVPVNLPDSLTEGGDDDVSLAELDLAAQSVMDTIVASGYQAPPDSTTTEEDSVYVITRDKELRLLKYDPDSIKYHVVDVRLNVDQDNYMWYLRDYLILPDVRLAKMSQSGGDEGKSGKSSKKGERKGIKGFFKNLFKRKNREEADTTESAPPPKEEFDYIDTTAVDGGDQPQLQQQTKKKKKEGGFFSFLKKKDKGTEPAVASDGTTPTDKPKKPKKEKKKKVKKKKGDEPVEEEKKEEEKDDGF